MFGKRKPSDVNARARLEQKAIDAVRTAYSRKGLDVRGTCLQKRAAARNRYRTDPSGIAIVRDHIMSSNKKPTAFDRRCQQAVLKARTLQEVFDASLLDGKIPCWDTKAFFVYYPDDTNGQEAYYRVHEHQDALYRMWSNDDEIRAPGLSESARFERFKKYLADSMGPTSYSDALTRDGYVDRTGYFANSNYGADWQDNEHSLYRGHASDLNEGMNVSKALRADIRNYKLDSKTPDDEYCGSGAYELAVARRNKRYSRYAKKLSTN